MGFFDLFRKKRQDDGALNSSAGQAPVQSDMAAASQASSNVADPAGLADSGSGVDPVITPPVEPSANENKPEELNNYVAASGLDAELTNPAPAEPAIPETPTETTSEAAGQATPAEIATAVADDAVDTVPDSPVETPAEPAVPDTGTPPIADQPEPPAVIEPPTSMNTAGSSSASVASDEITPDNGSKDLKPVASFGSPSTGLRELDAEPASQPAEADPVPSAAPSVPAVGSDSSAETPANDTASSTDQTV